MITNIVATWPCGHKFIRGKKDLTDSRLRFIRGLVYKGKRAHLVQVCVQDPIRQDDIREIVSGIRPAVHPIHGKVTVNGECLKEWIDSVKKGGWLDKNTSLRRLSDGG